MSAYTIISFYTPNFSHFASSLKADCDRLGYPHRIVETDPSRSLTAIWDRKVDYILENLRELGSVLWLDVECRLLTKIPDDWIAPLTCTFQMKNGRPLSTGALMLSKEHIPFVELWSKYSKKYAELPDDFVLEFLLRHFDLSFQYIHTEFFDRTNPAQVVRGQWKTEHTVIQHSTINRWETPTVYSETFNGTRKNKRTVNRCEERARKRKYIYWRNFGGDYDEVDALMNSRVDKDFEVAEWVFNPSSQQYSPKPYWPSISEDFGVKPLTKEKYRRNINNGFAENKHRQQSLRRMRLNREDRPLAPGGNRLKKLFNMVFFNRKAGQQL